MEKSAAYEMANESFEMTEIKIENHMQNEDDSFFYETGALHETRALYETRDSHETCMGLETCMRLERQIRPKHLM